MEDLRVKKPILCVDASGQAAAFDPPGEISMCWSPAARSPAAAPPRGPRCPGAGGRAPLAALSVTSQAILWLRFMDCGLGPSKERVTRVGKGNLSKSHSGQSGNLRQLPMIESAPRRCKRHKQEWLVSRDPGGWHYWAIHKAGTGFTLFGSPLWTRERDPDSAVIKKQRKTIFGLKRSHSRVKIVLS